MDIKAIQKKLNDSGFGILEVDGDFGENTKKAVIAFQKANGLEPDGKVGINTLAKMFPEEPCETPDKFSLQPWVATNKSLALRALEIAVSQNGVQEKTGKNDGAAVEAFLASVGLPKGYAWCMAFVYWAFQQASHELNVKNPLIRTAGVLRQWNETKLSKVKTPKAGDIFIMDFGGGAGHTGLVVGLEGKTKIRTFEGNTNDAGSREGLKAMFRIRTISSCKGFIRIS